MLRSPSILARPASKPSWASTRRPARLQCPQGSGSLPRAAVGDVTVILGERKFQLTEAEASELHDLLVERNLTMLALQSELSRALQDESSQDEVLADEEMRQELLLCLDANEAELRLTEGLRTLRQAARVPITPRPEY
jgi:hypothetical protein